MSIRQKRSGFTLLEIVLAIALAAIALSLLSQLVSMGNQAASVARDSSKAQLIAESVMAQVMAGIMPAQTTSGVWELDSMWSYNIDVTLGASQTINIVRVSVIHNVESSRPTTFNLTQWLAIPPEPEEEGSDLTGGGI